MCGCLDPAVVTEEKPSSRGAICRGAVEEHRDGIVHHSVHVLMPAKEVMHADKVSVFYCILLYVTTCVSVYVACAYETLFHKEQSYFDMHRLRDLIERKLYARTQVRHSL